MDDVALVGGIAHLKSYSLHVLHPGTAPYRRFLTQPIALTVPQMGHHDKDSWERVPPHVKHWREFKALRTTAPSETGQMAAFALEEERLLDVLEKELKAWVEKHPLPGSACHADAPPDGGEKGAGA